MAYAYQCQGTEGVPWSRHVLVQIREQLRGQDSPVAAAPKKDATWDWTAECQQAFHAVKQGLTEAPIMAVADQDRQSHVVCDASDSAIECAFMNTITRDVIAWSTINRVS
ncbi:unnamed protein product [Phytophthora fragariaefolia]|uniref:Unnamed protein product n=1 Tax=Phytophthora fragariaefolia TaxID=1490495 RepID=A0A9W6X0Q4_9STRA|nr:unnamed protein product [Phytophthora fragariaefolia]